MLVVDLNRLEREGRARIEADISRDAELWEGSDLTPTRPLEVRLEAQQVGPDVVVRGTLAGSFARECRRCLEPVEAEISEDVGLLYRAGNVLEDDSEDVLPLPDGAKLDLTGPIREQVLVAVPQYVQCREDCKGLCARCGTNLNESSCDCATEEVDERWAPLRKLKRDA